MQNKYAGDVHDYRKFGLLRILEASGFRKICVVWKLTEHDEPGEGKKRAYLENPVKYDKFDQPLFSKMKKLGKFRRRKKKIYTDLGLDRQLPLIPWIETRGILKNTQYLLYHFKKPQGQVAFDLVFFDPDNGIEVKSAGKGKCHADKYVRWDEIMEAWDSGASVLVYQHFPREKRELYTRRRAIEMSCQTGGSEVMAFRTRSVLFLLAVQNGKNIERDSLSEGLDRWKGEIWVDFVQPRLQVMEVAD